MHYSYLPHIPLDSVYLKSSHLCAKVTHMRAGNPKQMVPLQFPFVSRMTSEREQDELEELAKELVTISFTYQQIKCCAYNADMNTTLWSLMKGEKLDSVKEFSCCFGRLEFPDRNELRSYVQANGYSSEKAVVSAKMKWEDNDFVIPMPPFIELLKEQLVAPFFVFQVGILSELW